MKKWLRRLRGVLGIGMVWGAVGGTVSAAVALFGFLFGGLALTEIVEMMPKDRKVIPAGQNVRMDVIFLERAFKKCGIPYPFDYHVIDLATLFYSWSLVAGEEVPALSLRQAATTAGLIDGPVPHRALDDARLTLEAFRHYIGRLAPREPAVSPDPPKPDGGAA